MALALTRRTVLATAAAAPTIAHAKPAAVQAASTAHVRRNARYVNKNLAHYLIPVNADIGEIEVIMIPEEDAVGNPLGIKGIGELGNVGMNAAVANAIYHATGLRVREIPIRLERLFPAPALTRI